ncbi:unnamed protein product, partial [Brassica oleracea var. botrytis]
MVYTYKIPFVGNYNHFTLRFLALLHPTFLLNLRKVKNKRINKQRRRRRRRDVYQ